MQTVNFTGSVPVSHDFAPDISNNVKIEVTQSEGKINLTVSAPSTTAAGDYTTVATFRDADGNSDTVNITVKVEKDNDSTTPTPTPQENKISITGNAAVSLKAGAETNTTLKVEGNPTGSIKWTVGTISNAGLTVNAAASENNSAVITVKAAATVPANTYSVTITATDGANKSANATLRITVTSANTPTPPSTDTPDTPDNTDNTNIIRNYGSSSSSSGCNSGLYSLMFAVVFLPLISVKKTFD